MADHHPRASGGLCAVSACGPLRCGRGYIAKRFGWQTELGAYLDPIADKALLVSTYFTLGLAGLLPGNDGSIRLRDQMVEAGVSIWHPNPIAA